METLTSRQAYSTRWLSVREDDVRRADGSTGTYRVVEAEDIALVVPVDGDRLCLVEQYRHPVGGRRWEFPSGSIEPSDDDAAATALRELREETGLVAGSVTHLGTVEITPSTMTQRCFVFLATDLTDGPPEHDPEEQGMRSAWFTRGDVEALLRDGVLTDAKSLAAWALLRASQVYDA